MEREDFQRQIDALLQEVLDVCLGKGLRVSVLADTESGPFMYKITRSEASASESGKVSDI